MTRPIMPMGSGQSTLGSGEMDAVCMQLDAMPRYRLAHLPTPLMKFPILDRRLGLDLWIKRDDVTGGAEAGNKLRKLEFLLADAQRNGADTVITCGGVQSNHARATALTCARLGLKCVLLLRVANVDEYVGGKLRESLPMSGNVFLDLFAGASIQRIDLAQYRDRGVWMAQAKTQLEQAGRKPYIIVEGGSDGLGSLGYVEAMREVRNQIALGLAGPSCAPFDVVVVACGSGGTAAGTLLGSHVFGVARQVRAMAVCDSAAIFQQRIEAIAAECATLIPALKRAASHDGAQLRVDDHAKGPGYAISTPELRAFIVDVARSTGLVLDPVYTGKALFGLAQAVARGDVPVGSRVLWVHTGGLPGLLADASAFQQEL